MVRRIHGMTTGQTNRVCEKVLALTREWLLEHAATDDLLVGAAAMADLNRDCYVGLAECSYTSADGQSVSQQLVWRLDHTFAAIGEPEVRPTLGS
ncbi:MAG: hypothetical protein IVW36_07575 [Dehalococcoidia bacterium]|nr:hypothetical protein [Dehalococcoidia bacterium]